MRSSIADHMPDGTAFVAVEIVHDDHIAGLQCGHENLLHIGLEALLVDGAIKDKGSGDAVAAKCSKERQRLPVAVRQLGVERLTFLAPTPEPGHVGLDPCLIDEDKARGFNPRLVFLPPQTFSGDVRPILLTGVNGFF